MLAGLDLVDDGLGDFSLHKLIDPDGAGVVRHIKAHHPRLPPGQLPVLHIEHIPFNQDVAHVKIQLADGYRFFLSVNFAIDLPNPFLSPLGAWDGVPHQLAAHRLHLGEKVRLLFFLLPSSGRGRMLLCRCGRLLLPALSRVRRLRGRRRRWHSSRLFLRFLR